MAEPIGLQLSHPDITDLGQAMQGIMAKAGVKPRRKADRKTWYLTDDIVSQIRDACEHKTRDETWQQIADRFGIHHNTLRYIRNNSIPVVRVETDIYHVLAQRFEKPERYINELLRYALHRQGLIK